MFLELVVVELSRFTFGLGRFYSRNDFMFSFSNAFWQNRSYRKKIGINALPYFLQEGQTQKCGAVYWGLYKTS